MAIRFRKYKSKNGATLPSKAIRITEKNLAEIVLYINRNGGAATGHNGDTRSGRPPRIRIKQRNYGENWGKIDWRVAAVGDFIVRIDYPNGEEWREVGAVEFSRVKSDVFDDFYELVK